MLFRNADGLLVTHMLQSHGNGSSHNVIECKLCTGVTKNIEILDFDFGSNLIEGFRNFHSLISFDLMLNSSESRKFQN